MPNYDGIFPLYKPKGLTSHDCIFKLRKLLHFKKIGHTGTLDPEVDGVLPICLGRATKIAQYLLDYAKTYEGVIRLGTATDTEDGTGLVVKEKQVSAPFSRKEIERVLAAFTGELEQKPPMYSAVKVNGRKLYDYARAGITVDRPVRHIKVYDIVINSNEAFFKNDIPFRVSCSKGTYVRTLAVDIGKALGFPAHLKQLTRVAAGPFTIKDCISFEKIEQLLREERFESCLLPLENGIAHLDSLTVGDDLAEKVMNGAVLPMPQNFQNRLYSIYNIKGDCLAIYRPHPTKQGLIKPEKVLASRENQ